MKKFLFLVCLSLFSQFVCAQFNGNGFYRVQNTGTKRYLTVVDHRASVNMATTDPDLAAILPIRSFERIVGNPGSVIYIYQSGTSDYSLRAQGVDSYDLMGVYLNLRKLGDGSYYAYARAQGMTKYLYDEDSRRDEGWLMTKGVYRNWNIIPLNSSSDNYFGVLPEIEHNGSFYTTMYAAFPYKSVSSDTRMYYAELVRRDVAVLKEIKDNFVPAATAVIVKCSSSNASDNRLDVFASGGSAVTGNCLGGVYFDNDNKKHWNRLAYDPNTMRVLGVMKDGSLGFITADLDYLPANKAYLKVPAGSPEEIRLISEDDYATGVEFVPSADNNSLSFFDLSGRKVVNLASGIYISCNGKKFCR